MSTLSHDSHSTSPAAGCALIALLQCALELTTLVHDLGDACTNTELTSMALDAKRRDQNTQGVTEGTDQTSGECFLGQIIPI